MAQWQYKGDDGWVDYDEASCATLTNNVGATKLVIGDRIYAIDAERQFQTNEVTGYRRAIRCLADCVVASEGAPMLQQPGPRQHPGVGAGESPLVSVCIVHHERGERLLQAVGSVRAQTYRRA